MEGEAGPTTDLQAAPDDSAGEARRSVLPCGAVTCSVEVERKFVIPEDMGQRVEALGGVLRSRATFEDAYWDRGDSVLTMADHWLRRRDGRWQLKSPPARSVAEKRTTQVYLETEDEHQIVTLLQPLLKPDLVHNKLEPDQQQPDHQYMHGDKTNTALEEMLASVGCTEFASFRTERKTYRLGSFSVDLDFADFGFQVGEIEMLVADENEISQAVARIDELAQKLGVECEKRVAGKVDAYLKMYNPTLHQKLFAKHYL